MPEPLDYASTGHADGIHRETRWLDSVGDIGLFVFAAIPWLLVLYGLIIGFGLGAGGAICLCFLLNVLAWASVIPRLLSGGRKTVAYRWALWTNILFWPYFCVMCVVGSVRWS
jgi:hypothetical protein